MMKFVVAAVLVTSTAALTTTPTADVAAERRELTSVHYQGGYGTGSTYGQRNQNSWIGFLGGLALIVIAPFFLVMTEVQGVKIAKLISRAKASALPNVSSAAIDPSCDGFMLHVLGPLSVQGGNESYLDKDTGVSFGGLASARINASLIAFKLRSEGAELVASSPMKIARKVEVYQWVESEEKDAHSTDFVYQTVWSEVDVPSAHFQHAHNHTNPPRSVPIHSATTERPNACLGAFSLSNRILERADWWSDALIHPSTTLAPALLAKNARVVDLPDAPGAIYVPSGAPPHFGQAPGEPSIGDLRITYQTVEMPATDATCVGVQEGGTLRPYTRDDAAHILGQSAVAEETAELAEADKTALSDLLNDLSPMTPRTAAARPEGRPQPNCCKIWMVLSTIFAKLMLEVMRHVVGTDVGLLSPFAKSLGGMFLSETIRVERALAGFRLVGTLLFIAAFYLILHPIAALFSFIPFLGRLISSLFLVAAVLVGLTCALVTIFGAWLVVKPARSCIGFILLGGLYGLEIYFDYASLVPLYVIGGLALVAGLLAIKEEVDMCQFQAAAKRSLAGYAAGPSYVQVGMKMDAAPTKKDLV